MTLESRFVIVLRLQRPLRALTAGLTEGVIALALTLPLGSVYLEKEKKLFVSKESTAAILSRLGIRISIEHKFLFLDAEHPNRSLTTPFSGK